MKSIACLWILLPAIVTHRYERSDTSVSSPTGHSEHVLSLQRSSDQLRNYTVNEKSTHEICLLQNLREIILSAVWLPRRLVLFSLFIYKYTVAAVCLTMDAWFQHNVCLEQDVVRRIQPSTDSRINSPYPDIYADNRFPFALLSCVHYEVWSSSASLPGLEPVRLNTVDDDAELLNKPDDCKSCQIYENTHRAFECPSQS